jgi:hypothetical protein
MQKDSMKAALAWAVVMGLLLSAGGYKAAKQVRERSAARDCLPPTPTGTIDPALCAKLLQHRRAAGRLL